ncbi:uncharacterized protein BO80DRAFT_248734 [Aspergillus ibericus CBS 121593]|uniref:Uncharacterized protein n=1 Tax=Aspergillus ibericus CBS 121593 TaxID=1448316 RepID=A0A395GK50_9EURO|nr:hypothetical protein BO80DRAFT_248734 [Aspergillus ibericus CBS 121593]RAK95784.1 hypothetical protein BO80DRAFT_248734 [Aspergillus ibericus CBS 121593]
MIIGGRDPPHPPPHNSPNKHRSHRASLLARHSIRLSTSPRLVACWKMTILLGNCFARSCSLRPEGEYGAVAVGYSFCSQLAFFWSEDAAVEVFAEECLEVAKLGAS